MLLSPLPFSLYPLLAPFCLPFPHPPFVCTPPSPTFRVILAQLEGSGRGSLGSYNASAYELLSNQLLSGGASAISKDPDAFVEGLLDKDPALGERKEHIHILPFFRCAVVEDCKGCRARKEDTGLNPLGTRSQAKH